MATIQQIYQSLKRRARARADAGREHAHEVRARIPDAIRVLRERFGAQQIWLFGSLLRSDPTPSSDVDIAVVGMPDGDYFAALVELMAIFRCRVDLVQLERAPESLRRRIEDEGELL